MSKKLAKLFHCKKRVQTEENENNERNNEAQKNKIENTTIITTSVTMSTPAATREHQLHDDNNQQSSLSKEAKKESQEMSSKMVGEMSITASDIPDWLDPMPLDKREIFRLKSSWRAVHRQMQEAGIEIFLQYGNNLLFNWITSLNILNSSALIFCCDSFKMAYFNASLLFY